MSCLLKVLKGMLYDVNVMCTNCGHKKSIKILKGREVEDGLEYRNCSNCGTANLVKSV